MTEANRLFPEYWGIFSSGDLMKMTQNGELGCQAPTQVSSIVSTEIGRDIADYIAGLSTELGQMAAAKNMSLLAGLLQLASAEAKRLSDAPHPFVQ